MAYLGFFGLSPEMVSNLDAAALQSITTIVLGAVSVYATARSIYNLYFHPLAQFPGPKIAAISNVWYGYHWLTGRYPWAIQDALRKYGDVVRIAPNELVFVSPQAFNDIFCPQQKGLELFVKTDFNNRGKNMGGIIWEEDPVRHREVAKKLLPAFSGRALRSMEPMIHQYMDYFVSRMKELGSASDGVGLVNWTNWLSLDLSVDLAWSEQWNEMRDQKNAPLLDVLLGFNAFATVMQVFKRFPLISPVQYLFVPVRKLRTFVATEKATRVAIQRRIDRSGSIDNIDFFEYVLPSHSPIPTDYGELTHLGSVATQVMLAGWGSMADWYYTTFCHLLKEPDCLRILVKEIRDTFDSYSDITPSALAPLPYLTACLEESVRLMPSNSTGMPRLSPGAMVDGHYIPKGTHVQSSVFSHGRSPRYFHDPLEYRPQRWLSPEHPLYEEVYANDDRKGNYPFSLGPRVCIGKEMAWIEGRLLLAKVVWTFDMETAPGQRIDLDKTLLHFGLFVKPELKVRFLPVNRGQD
ncbi:cytochrome P450 [Thozetella sp. PMI_491]|nr:cytochrome P450 [Thozetella sp. PMI_491]